MKNKIKACLVAILSFVMVFTAIPFTAHADDQSAGEDVTGDATYNVEWIFVVVDKKPMLRMHLRVGEYDFYGDGCRQNNGNIRSRNAVYRQMTDGDGLNKGGKLTDWLRVLANAPDFSNIDLLHHTLLDFNYPLQNGFDWNYSDCYAVWTAEINNHPEFVFEDARTGEIAIEIDLESLQKKGGFDVYCSYDNDGIDSNELYQSKRYSDTTWDNTENRFIGLPDPKEGYHWELIWASFSDQNWFNYREIGVPTAVAWTDPNNHIDIANNGMALGGGTGVSPSDIPLTSEGFGAAICSSPTNKGLTGISERAF